MNATIVIFANSVKHREHCIAGKDINSHKWIRPVSNQEGAALSEKQCLYENPYGKFTKVKPLQKIEMTLSGPAPLPNQPENYLVSDRIWRQHYKIQGDEIQNYLDRPNSLWGESNKVNYAKIENGEIHISQSLYLVQITNLQLRNDDSKRRAEFQYAGVHYNLPVTDPYFEEQFKEPNNQGILCISLGEKHDPKGGDDYSCYKIVATIL